MNVTIHGRPSFTFPIKPEELAILVALSQSHYDGYCRSISTLGGFLRGWQNRMTWMKEEGSKEDLYVTATWSEIDTLLKVLETSAYLPTSEAMATAGELSRQLNAMLDEASKLNTTWQKDITV